MEKKFLDYDGLVNVANKVNSRLKTVTEMPSTASDGAIRLFCGETDEFTKGHIYQYSEEDTQWVDITSSESVQVSTVAELEAIEVGTIVQYVGATTSTYTKGYFYTKSQLSATLNVTAGSGYYSTSIGTSELESTLPYSLYGGWTLNSVSDVDTAVTVISDTNKEVTCDNTDITITNAGEGSIMLSYSATGEAPSDPFTVTMSATVISAVSTMVSESIPSDVIDELFD